MTISDALPLEAACPISRSQVHNVPAYQIATNRALRGGVIDDLTYFVRPFFSQQIL